MKQRFNPGDRVRIIVSDDMFTGLLATVRERRRRNSPRRFVYTLDIDDHPMKYGAGPYVEKELELVA